MKRGEVSRRTFLGVHCVGVGGVLAGMMVSSGCVSEEAERASTETVSRRAAKTLNYHPQMAYRRLGKTNLMVSEVVLAGSFGEQGSPYSAVCGGGAAVSAEAARLRTEVISACIDCGINYLDITSGEEAAGYRAALKGRRERMYVAADDRAYCMRHERYRNAEGQMQNIESCLRNLGTDYLDVWRMQCKPMDGHRDLEMEMGVKVFERARQQGKVRFLGVATGDRAWIRHLLDRFEQYAVIYTPYTLRSETRVSGLESIDRDRLYEPSSWGGRRQDTGDKLFERARAGEVGVIATEALGTNIEEKKQAAEGAQTNLEQSRLTLACVLSNPDLSAVAVAMNSASQVQAYARVSAERRGQV